MPTPTDTTITVFSSLGCVLNNALFISQTPMLIRLVKEGDSTRYPFLPSLTLMAVMTAWSCYTFWVTPLTSIIVANVPGVIINLINLMVIAFYAKSRARGVGIFALAWFTLGAVVAVFIPIFERHERAYAAATAGAIMASLNACFFLSPLRALVVAVRNLDVSAVPTSLSYVQLLQSGVWIVVGALYPDPFIIGVNAAGAVLALVQIAMISYVRHRTHGSGGGGGGGGVGGGKPEPPAVAVAAAVEGGCAAAAADADPEGGARDNGDDHVVAAGAGGEGVVGAAAAAGGGGVGSADASADAGGA